MVTTTKSTIEKVKKFVLENLVTADNKGIVCIDGRYRPEQSEGKLRAPGGDLGMVMAFAAACKDEGLGISSDEIVERYDRTVARKRGENGRIFYHSDNSGHGTGCGHVNFAMNPQYEGRYGSLIPTEVEELYNAFINHPNAHKTVLEGDHNEQSVIFVHGKSEESPITHSVNSSDTDGNMHFVVDLDRAFRFIEKATPHFSEGLEVPLRVEDVKRNFLQQLNATADILAPNLDKYKVILDPHGNAEVEKLLPQTERTN